MGCLFSKNGQVRTLSDDLEEPLPASAFSTRGAAHAWLQEIGLPQYGEVFDKAGFSDWDLLSCLTEADLEAITAHTGTVIPPGHRKKLLMASRQMGASANQPSVGGPPPCASARRYSHSSNPGGGNGNSSRAGGGLAAAAAAAAVSLERRSNGLRPSSTSRVSNPASVHSGHGGQQHLQVPPGSQSRAATEDGLVSGRRSRMASLLIPSRNSSRSSLLAVAITGHAIGYIASPSVSGVQDAAATVATSAGGGGSCDPCIVSDGWRSPADPGSPHVGPASVAGPGGLTPQRQRRRWSANKYASRGVLVGGGSNAGGPGNALTWASSCGWLEQDVATAAVGTLSGAGPITDDVRQVSLTSSISDTHGIAGGGAGGRGGSLVHAQPLNTRDLEALVVGASGGTNPGTSARGQSLAPTRPDKSYRGPGSHHEVTTAVHPRPYRRFSGGQPVGGGAGGLQASLSVRGLQTSVVTTAVQTRQQQQPSPAGQSRCQSQPNIEVNDQTQAAQQSQHRQQRTASAHDSTATIAPAATAAAATAAAPSQSVQRPGSAAESTLKSWAAGLQLSSPPPTPPLPPQQQQKRPVESSTASAGAPLPGVAWGFHGDGDAAAVLSSSPGSPGGGGGALPRFVRAIAGWAIPIPVGAASDGTTGSDAAAPPLDGARRACSVNRQRRALERQSAGPQFMQPRAHISSAVPSVGQVSERQQKQSSKEETHVTGAGLGAAATSGSAARGAGGGRGRRPQHCVMLPDAFTPRGPWDQDMALCIQGRGYKPPVPMPPAVSVPGALWPGAATVASSLAAAGIGSSVGNGGSSGAADGDDSDAPWLLLANRPALTPTVSAPSGYAVAAAARSGGWPFVMPQLPQPTKSPPAADGPGPAAAMSAATAQGPGSGDDSAAAVNGSYSAVVASSTPQYGRASVVPETLPSVMLESLTSDTSAATTTARRVPPVHSSRPRDWCPSVGGASEEAAMAAEHSGVNPSESSADELALYGTSDPRLPHRVQIMSSAIAMASPYHGSDGGGPAGAQWPAMPLQPPTRAKPPPATALKNGGGGIRYGRMEVLPPEAAGSSRTSPLPPRGDGGGGGSGRLPRPTPGRKLDLEMLADQVGRIMSHLSYITKDGTDADDADMIAAPMPAGPGAIAPVAAATAPAVVAAEAGEKSDGPRRRIGKDGDGVSGDGGGGGGAEQIRTAASGSAPGSGASPSRAGSRKQAIDQKRMELQQLHQDLVRRVAALATAADSALPPSAAAAATAATGGDGTSHAVATAAEDSVAAADALAEVEWHIRTKLAELAMLTMRPASERRAADAGGGGGRSSSGVSRKRTLGSESLSAPTPGAADWDAGNQGGGGGEAGGGGAGRRFPQGQQQHRAREAALHMEVLAVLGARKRQVKGTPVAAAAAAEPTGGKDDYDQLRQQQRLQGCPWGPEEGPGSASSHQLHPSTPGRVIPAVPGQPVRDDAVLADMHDSLRAEILAIDGKVKARVQRGFGAAVSQRA